MDIKSSLIIATYNRKDLLHKTLLALARQTVSDFEVFIACDGSTDGTKEMCDNLRSSLPYTLVWIEQADHGFRKSLVLNKAVLLAKGRQLIFLDDDCIPTSSFIAAHELEYEHGALVLGKFIGVPQKYRYLFSEQGIKEGAFESRFNWREKLDLFFWRLKYRRWIKQKHPSRPKMNGCNFSVCRDAMVAVNGYDLDFTGWGYEDNDLRRRLLVSGVVLKEAVYQARVFNLATDACKDETGVASTVQEVDVTLRDSNKAKAKDVSRPVVCAHGLSQIDPADIEAV